MEKEDTTQPLEALREAFRQPPAEFTQFPFWFLNGALEEGELKRQLQDFKAHGIDGVVLHPRLGLTDDIEYLGSKYMQLIRATVAEAARLDMRVMLYDEAMYPSGAAHGLVVRGNPEYAARAIRAVEFPLHDGTYRLHLAEGEQLLAAAAIPQRDGHLDLTAAENLPVGETELTIPPAWRERDANGYAIVATYSHGTIRGVHFGEDDGEPGAPQAADLLNPAAMQKFLHVTYDAYHRELKEYFGSTVIAFFTDEPSIMGRCVDEKSLKPWSKDFLACYMAAGNVPLDLLALWYDVGEGTAELQRRYWRCINERLGVSYYAQLSDWCVAHGIALTGHPAHSDDIGCLRYFQIPGQDLVWRWVAPEKELAITGRDSTLAKCASDGARHHGARRNLNEAMGCCGPVGHPWDFTAGEMKWYYDWLFVRGTNLLVPHAFLYSVDGEPRYNERPPDVGPNNAWWPYYRYFADYAKRLSWLNTDSYNTTPIAVLCQEDHLPWRIVRPLYEQQLEFNYLEESLLTAPQTRIEAGHIAVAHQSYTVLLVEDEAVFPSATRAAVQTFRQQGGTVLTLAEVEAGEHPALTAVRECRLLPASSAIRLTHVVKGGRDFYLLVNEGQTDYIGQVFLRQQGKVESWDAWTGQIRPAELQRSSKGSCVALRLTSRQSVILMVDAQAAPQAVTVPHRRQVLVQPLADGWQRRTADGEWQAVDTLGDWTWEEPYHDYYGVMYYRHMLELPARVNGQRAVIELGAVGELAEVFIDGESQGVSLWAPYCVDVTPALADSARRVTLAVKVTSSISRRFTTRVRPSGLIGPVQFKVIR
ncbi:MAG: hypothetical protein PUB57_05480 [Selenomonadaceae bacterium]|nr:hypothetical protein [Selenomonadaceae bacterium]